MTVPFWKAFHRIQHMTYQLNSLLFIRQFQINGGNTTEKRHADIGGRGSSGRTKPRPLLYVIRWKPVIFWPQPVLEIPPNQPSLMQKEGVVLLRRPSLFINRAG